MHRPILLPALAAMLTAAPLTVPAQAQPDLRIGKVEYLGSVEEGSCNTAHENNNRLMVPNPPFSGYCAQLSVADTSGPESRRMAFTVTLSETSTHPIAVDYYSIEAAPAALKPATAGSACGKGVDFVAARSASATPAVPPPGRAPHSLEKTT